MFDEAKSLNDLDQELIKGWFYQHEEAFSVFWSVLEMGLINMHLLKPQQKTWGILQGVRYLRVQYTRRNLAWYGKYSWQVKLGYLFCQGR